MVSFLVVKGPELQAVRSPLLTAEVKTGNLSLVSKHACNYGTIKETGET
jgi:hypothetical protein